MNQEVFAAVADALERGEMAALVTIVATTGSTPQRIGAKMLVFADGRIVGTIGGGCYENDAFWKAREAITDRRPQIVHYELSDDFAQETGLICGGQVELYIEPTPTSPARYLGRPRPLGLLPGRLAPQRARADWSGHRRRHTTGNCGQHPRGADCGQARQGEKP